jgi:hypothetical protein
MPDVSTEVAIATTTLGTAANTISFSSIPATYTDLRIVLAASGVTTSGNEIRIEMNNDAANFGATFLTGNPATGVSSGRGTNTYGRLSGNSGTAGTGPFLVTADLFSYRGSTQKTLLADFFPDNNGSGVVVKTVNLFLSTAAITQLTLRCDGTFSIGTTATIYGIL